MIRLKKLENKIKNLYSFLEIYWFELDHILNGQLLTAIESVKKFDIKGPIIIHNCDTSFRRIKLNSQISFNSKFLVQSLTLTLKVIIGLL